MTTTIDAAGRIVIPKAIREAAELAPGSEVEIAVEDGRVILAPVLMRTHLEERDGIFVLVPESPVPPLSQETVDRVPEEIRTRR